MIQLSTLDRTAGRAALVFVVFLVASGCASTNGPGLTSDKVNYGNVISGPALDVPPDLARPATNDAFTLPAGVTNQKQALLPDITGVRMERAGGQRWLVVNQPPEKVWPAVEEFLRVMGLPVEVKNRSVGLIETGWAQNLKYLEGDLINRIVAKALPNIVSVGVKDKYRIRIERAAKPGETEIYLTHRGLEEVSREQLGRDSEVVWQPRPSDPELETEMLRMLMLHLGLPAARATEVLATPVKDHARLVNEGGVARLILDGEEPERAWRRVGVALDALDVVVEERDRAQGTYTVRYNAPAKAEAGFFAKVFGGEKVQATGGEYQLHVAPVYGGAEVLVTPRNGATAENGAQILAWLQKELK